ncbi:MAG TPA: hypothetical protein VGH93_07735 [Solirubrobacteraceae bacterium]
MRIERERPNVFTVTATSRELAVLVAAARMALEAMESAPEPPPSEALEALRRVLSEFDSARAKLTANPPEGGAGPAEGAGPEEGSPNGPEGGSNPPEGG